MLNHPRRLTLPRPTAAPTATQLRAVLTLHLPLQFSIYAIAASPLIVATDIRNMTSIMTSLLLNKHVLHANH